jgi:orotidine-5'-phosphate decarboxylase
MAALSDRIIVPLDVPSTQQAIALLDQLPQVAFWKVGLELFVNDGPEVIQLLQARGKRIFLDLKFHDIPNTVAGACRSIATRYQVDLLTVHAAAGRVALQEAVAAVAAAPHHPQVVAITLLTSFNSRDLAFDLHIPLELPEYAKNMAILAQESGCGGAVCSPQEVASLRQTCGQNFTLICPGVRPSWSAMGDQRRTLTPKQAFQAGANYLVIGRPITAAVDPKAAWEKICAEIASI